ncbi:MAG: hypothetical protein WD270_08100 [Acetobacterales bacterium]
MPKMATVSYDERSLSKGQIRKLNALRKSVGPEIGEKAFAEWLADQEQAGGLSNDRNAQLISETLWPLIQKNQLRIPRGGYLVRRGRGRIIVESGA